RGVESLGTLARWSLDSIVQGRGAGGPTPRGYIFHATRNSQLVTGNRDLSVRKRPDDAYT
ncbi:MAG TPA: hypothetical protein VFO40_00395, partial [Chthoniobacterales bacterium]|nr:hypothetical protein [Chthoniobacterales bacterium]